MSRRRPGTTLRHRLLCSPQSSLLLPEGGWVAGIALTLQVDLLGSFARTLCSSPRPAGEGYCPQGLRNRYRLPDHRPINRNDKPLFPALPFAQTILD
jgi:hypothetical protein